MIVHHGGFADVVFVSVGDGGDAFGAREAVAVAIGREGAIGCVGGLGCWAAVEVGRVVHRFVGHGMVELFCVAGCRVRFRAVSRTHTREEIEIERAT